MHTVKPLDSDAVFNAVEETSAIATLEEHSVVGGLGGAVAEILAEYGTRKVPFTRIGVESAFATKAGDQEYLRATFGLTSEHVVKRLVKLVGQVNNT